jgi:hypothetical protein
MLISENQQEIVDGSIQAATLSLMDHKEYLKEIGSKGGKARAAKMTPEERTKSAVIAVSMREYLKELKKKKTS